MKKQFIFILMSIFTMLFAACSQENELDTPAGEKSNLVSVSTQLPTDFAKTRALPGAAGHKLRCILEVWSTGENAARIHRIEQIGESTADDITFSFSLENEGDYDCLMWADFIDANAAITDGKYTDKYYTTTDLKAIEIKDLTNLFNNDACDAFFVKDVLKKTSTAGTLGAKLTRPFAKLTLMENEKNATTFATCTNVTVSYDAPSKFNVMDGSVSESKTVTYSSAPKGTEGTKANVYFTSYILADANGSLGEISLAFTAGEGTSPITKKIPAGVPAKQNYRTNATGFLMGAKPANSQDASVKVEIDGKWTGEENTDNAGEVREPAVGDFYYSDGSYSEKRNTEKTCIGVVFAVGEGKDDVIGNYADTDLTEIKGYVVSLTDAAKNVICPTKAAAAPFDLSGVSKDNTQFNGYSNTKAITSQADYETVFLAINACIEYEKTLAAPAKTSGWYLPSGGQVVEIAKKYYTSPGENPIPAILQTKLLSLNEDESHLFLKNNYWGSNIDVAAWEKEEEGDRRASFRTSFDFTKTSYGNSSTSPFNGAANVRPILTF